jgi:class 3 adenylate cyclase
VTCSDCGTENAPDARFCKQCGARLGLTCSNCGLPLLPDARFCSSCGTPTSIAPGPAQGRFAPAGRPPTPAPAPVAERRLVSILFADLVGFTTLAEGRDAEDTRELLSRYFDLGREVIERYGGTVEKFIGDAVMAVWGAPTAREDDAELAVRAALELVESVHTLGPSLSARAGVLTGEAAVTLGAVGQGMVAGDVVNTASRLQSVARPGTVLVGEATQRAASKAIAFEPAGEQALKGKAAPVPAWQAVRVVAERGGRNRSETLEAPFVGRQDELRLLKELFHATGREGRSRLVSVIGAGRHRQDAPGLGVPQVRGRPPGRNLVARRPLPCVRRGDQLLGPRRDGPPAVWPPRERRRAHDPGEGRRDGAPVRPGR